MKERAKNYAELHSRGWSGENKRRVFDTAYKDYIKIASEQRDADVEKAIGWLVEHEYFGCKDSAGAEAFRKAMEEE